MSVLHQAVKPVTATQLVKWGVLVERGGELLPTWGYVLLSGHARMLPSVKCGIFINRINSLGSAVYKQVTPPEVGELSPDSDFMGEVFVPDFENKRIYNNGLGKQFAVHVVSDRNKFNEVLEKGQKMADEWDDLVHQVLPDHPLSPKIEALVQTVASKPVRRSLEGFSEP